MTTSELLGYSNAGPTCPGAAHPDCTTDPEKQFQPRFAPDADVAGRKVISYLWPPTSPT